MTPTKGAALALAVLLLAACARATPTPAPTSTPTPLPTSTATPQPAATTQFTPTPLPTPTATPQPTSTPTPRTPPTPTTTPLPPRLEAARLTTGLELATGLAIAPDGRIFVSERWKGRIRIIEGGKLRPDPFAELPVVALQETGLLGLALHPDYPSQPYLYAYHTYRAAAGSLRNRVVRLREADGRAAETTVIFDNIPAASIHNGGILTFGPDGKLYVTTGDATQRELAQDPKALNGKVLRLNPDGSVPADNPFPGSPVYTLGHRNVFGLAFHPQTGRAYITENGPDRDDEVNLLRPGGNYGWPIVTGVAGDTRFIDPLVTYTPNIAPTQAALYTGPVQAYRGDLFFGDWNTGSLRRMVLEAPNYDRAVKVEVVLRVGPGIIAVAQGRDGYLYFTTQDTLWRVVPQAATAR